MKSYKDEFRYHGTDIHEPYFEGWYYKIVTENVACALIAGIAKNKREDHAFIQTIDTISKHTQYQRFPMEEVMFQEDPFLLKIDDNQFAKHRIQAQIGYFKIDVNQYAFTDLQTSRYAPTIMGPFSYLSHMQCTHSIISLYHYVKGILEIENVKYPVKGIGYMEKDRGVSFPSSYLWTQSNSCELERTCFFLSIAKIPISFISFTGCICVMLINGKQFRFTSYDGARIRKLDIVQFPKHREANIHIRQGNYDLHVHLQCLHAYPLIAPQGGMMEPKVMESLESIAHIRLYHRNVLLHELHFDHAGCEIRME